MLRRRRGQSGKKIAQGLVEYLLMMSAVIVVLLLFITKIRGVSRCEGFKCQLNEVLTITSNTMNSTARSIFDEFGTGN
ncbi:MAG: hypothetical protein KBD53_10860 [Candidatus Omnitrophica bacterium]|nr:hypothetical protein [Candidatus Omnitrophota bacterium]